MDPSYLKGLFKYDVGEVLGDKNVTGEVRSRLFDVDAEKRMYVVDWELPFGNDWSITSEDELDELDIIDDRTE